MVFQLQIHSNRISFIILTSTVVLFVSAALDAVPSIHTLFSYFFFLPFFFPRNFRGIVVLYFFCCCCLEFWSHFASWYFFTYPFFPFVELNESSCLQCGLSVSLFSAIVMDTIEFRFLVGPFSLATCIFKLGEIFLSSFGFLSNIWSFLSF